MTRMPPSSVRVSVLLAAMCLPVAAKASGLQVEPVSVVIEDRSNVMWLSNAGDAPLQAQVRVYRWVQDAKGERLEPTDALLASPPMARIAPGGRQLVRLVSTGAGSCEDSYRLAIDEVPSAALKASGLRYVLHSSVPVFVAPRACGKITPALHWRMERDHAGANLIVANQGTMHAQLAQVSFADAQGKRTQLTAGLLGYVLPGAERKFSFPLAASALGPLAASALGGSGTLEVQVNGSHITQAMALAAPAR